MKKLLASSALSLCLIGAPAFAQTDNPQTGGAQTSFSGPSGSAAQADRRDAGVRFGYWAGLGAANRDGNAGPAFWSALVAAANSRFRRCAAPDRRTPNRATPNRETKGCRMRRATALTRR